MMTEAPAQTPTEAISERAVPELAAAIIGAIAAYEPLRLHLVFVRDWFGPNWMGFKGKFQGMAGMHSGPGRPLAIPPFNPNRVEQAAWYERATANAPWRVTADQPLNIAIGSEAASRRYFEKIAGPHAMAAWVGDDGQGRQATMVYAMFNGEEVAWYANTEPVGQAGSKFVGIGEDEFKLLQHAAG